MYVITSFYKFIELKNPSKLVEELKEKCEELNVLGRILIGKEGISAAVCGKKQDMKEFQNYIYSKKEFQDIFFKDQNYSSQVYHKLVVLERDEIIVLEKNIDLSKKGDYISTKELKELYDNNEDFIIIDGRNDYEYEVGHFKNAINPNTKTFRDFPKKLKELEKYKDKKIITYCTGGIRCEKASAVMKEAGFEKVYQLKDGIIKFMDDYPETYWQGGCFVFDNRLVRKKGGIGYTSKCEICHKDCKDMINCRNLDCDKLFVCCKDCQKEMNFCCSEECKSSPRQRRGISNKNSECGCFEEEQIGKVINYYPKVKVALIETFSEIKKGDVVKIKGKTTTLFNQEVNEIRDYNGNLIEFAKEKQMITISVEKLARKNDLVIS
jgi:UPF0176 protein